MRPETGAAPMGFIVAPTVQTALEFSWIRGFLLM